MTFVPRCYKKKDCHKRGLQIYEAWTKVRASFSLWHLKIGLLWYFGAVEV
jgi:hypothetical protein